MQLRVLSWNLMHGRSVPGAGRDLLEPFTAALAGWEWDVALLQEVPPWWPVALARALGCEHRTALTSRNALLPLRRVIAQRAPDVIKSNGGGANAILARHDRIAADRTQVLCRRPERRVVQAVELGSGVWIATLHATAHDTAAARRDATAAVAAAAGWATGPGGRSPVIIGGDFNLRVHDFDAVSLQGLTIFASRDVDHILGDERVTPAAPAQHLTRPPTDEGATLSDHIPLAITLQVDLP